MTTLVIAHAGHWLVNLMYLAPVAGFLSWLGVVTWRERRENPRAPERQLPKERSDA